MFTTSLLIQEVFECIQHTVERDIFIHHWSAVTSELKLGSSSYIKVPLIVWSLFFLTRWSLTINQELPFPFLSLSVTSYTGTKVVLCPLSVLIFERRLWVNGEHVILNFSKGSQSAIKFVLPGDRRGEQRCQTVQSLICSSQWEVMW